MSDSIGKSIKNIRKRLGFTQTEVAEKLFTTPQNISRVESGEGEPTAEMLIGLADLFNVSVDTLMGRTEMPEKDLMEKLQTYFEFGEKEEVAERVFRVCESVLIGRYQKYFENVSFEGRETYSTLLKRNLTAVFSNRSNHPRVFAAVDTDTVVLCEESQGSLNEVFKALSKPSVMSFINNMSKIPNNQAMTYDRISFCSTFGIGDQSFEDMISSLRLLGLVTVKTVALNDGSVTVYQPHTNKNIVLLLSLADLLYNSTPDGNAH